MGFLLRAHAGTIELDVDDAGPLRTMYRGNARAVRVVYGDPLEPVFEPAAAGTVQSAAALGAQFARHCDVTITDDAAHLRTDHGGLCPLMYTRDRANALLVATSAGALLPRRGEPVQLQPGARRSGGTGFEGVAAVPAGTTVAVPLRKPGPARTVRHFPLPRPAPMSAELAVRRVSAVLNASVARLLRHHESAAVLLSGGVDSSTVAALARPRLRQLRSYTVGTHYDDEFAAARRVAELLDIEHAELVLSGDELHELLPRMIRLLETWDLDTLRITAPICFALDRLCGREHLLLTGYGADLLFAGLGADGDLDGVENRLRAGVIATGCSNEFSPALADADQLLVRHPYWTADMITTALTVPTHWKLQAGTVKWVLRQAAARVLPTEVTQRPKRAIQDGSGMHRLFAEVLGTGLVSEQAAALRRIAAEVFAAAPTREVDNSADLAGVAS